MVIGAERDLIDVGRSPEYIPELVLIVTQPLRSNSIPAESINQLPIHQLSAREKEDLDIRAARVCLVGGYPFTLFESEEMKHFCNGMNSEYKPPTRQRIAGDLLNRVYHDIQ